VGKVWRDGWSHSVWSYFLFINGCQCVCVTAVPYFLRSLLHSVRDMASHTQIQAWEMTPSPNVEYVDVWFSVRALVMIPLKQLEHEFWGAELSFGDILSCSLNFQCSRLEFFLWTNSGIWMK
jgi:glycyl-tRNA synthetase alpha subunit